MSEYKKINLNEAGKRLINNETVYYRELGFPKDQYKTVTCKTLDPTLQYYKRTESEWKPKAGKVYLRDDEPREYDTSLTTTGFKPLPVEMIDYEWKAIDLDIEMLQCELCSDNLIPVHIEQNIDEYALIVVRKG